MDSERIISRLWSVVYDLLLYNKGMSSKTLEEIEAELDALEYQCRQFTR